MSTLRAHAKLNLALVVGPLRDDGKHEVVTVMQTIDVFDDIALERAPALTVEGFLEDTLVRDALESLAAAAGVTPSWHVRIEKRIPVAAGLGGGSSDAAAALRLANALLAEPLEPPALHEIAARLGADTPFFLRGGSQLARGDGTDLDRLDLPNDYCGLLVWPAGESKKSTSSVYGEFDERGGAAGFGERRAALLQGLGRVERPTDLADLPQNDLASSPVTAELERLGAFRADVTGAGPVVYGLFEHVEQAEAAAAYLGGADRTWIVRPVV